jgi:hypothetical protein
VLVEPGHLARVVQAGDGYAVGVQLEVPARSPSLPTSSRVTFLCLIVFCLLHPVRAGRNDLSNGTYLRLTEPYAGMSLKEVL